MIKLLEIEKAQKDHIILTLKEKLVCEKGDPITMGNVGWAAVVILVVLAAFNILPDKVTSFLTAVFTKLTSGLGITM